MRPLADLDGKHAMLQGRYVRDANVQQVLQSTRHVYCREDDFALAREVCRLVPETMKPDRERVDIGQVLDPAEIEKIFTQARPERAEEE